MPTTQAPDPAYTLEHAQQDIAGLRGQMALQQDIISTVSDKALLLYAPDAHAIPRGPTSWSFEDGTTQGWLAGTAGAVSNSVVTATGWPTNGTHSLLLTANGSGQPQAFSPADTGHFIPSQPGDIVTVAIDIYCPAPLSHIYAGIKWRDDTGTLISEIDSADTVFSAGQVQTLMVSGTAPDLCAGFGIVFGDHNTDPNLTLIYGDNIRVKGNLAISASPGGGTDSVGNAYPAGYNTNGASGSTTIDPTGNIIMKNLFGAVVMFIDPGLRGLFFYQDLGSATQGGTIGASVWGTAAVADPVNSTTFQPGQTSFDPIAANLVLVQPGNMFLGNAASTAILAHLLGQGINSGPVRPYLLLGAPAHLAGDNHAAMLVEGTSPDGTHGPQIVAGTVVGNAVPTPGTTAFFEVQGSLAANSVTALVSGAAETWHNPVLAAGFSAANAVSYQLEPVDGGRVRLRGLVSLTANQAANAVIFTLPAGYVPVHNQVFVTSASLSGNALGSGTVKVDTSGNVSLVVAGNTPGNVNLDGIVIELD